MREGGITQRVGVGNIQRQTLGKCRSFLGWWQPWWCWGCGRSEKARRSFPTTFGAVSIDPAIFVHFAALPLLDSEVESVYLVSGCALSFSNNLNRITAFLPTQRHYKKKKKTLSLFFFSAKKKLSIPKLIYVRDPCKRDRSIHLVICISHLS